MACFLIFSIIVTFISVGVVSISQEGEKNSPDHVLTSFGILLVLLFSLVAAAFYIKSTGNVDAWSPKRLVFMWTCISAYVIAMLTFFGVPFGKLISFIGKIG